MKLSLVIPVYNEESNLKKVLDNLLTISFPCEVEYVIIDDCSKDNSWSIIQTFAKNPKIKIHKQEFNQGKGAALHKGFSLATGDIIAVQDADFEYDPKDLATLISPIIDNKADVVFGSRFRKTSPQVHRTIHYLGNRILTLFSNLCSGLYLTDMETCYKVFRADLLKKIPLEAKRFGFEPEVTAKIAKFNVRVHEYPISYYPRTYLEGKKIGWKDGVAALWYILKFNFQKLDKGQLSAIPKNYLPKAGGQWL